MSSAQLAFLRQALLQWRQTLVKGADETLRSCAISPIATSTMGSTAQPARPMPATAMR